MSLIFKHDDSREARIGIPEAVLAEWKTDDHLAHILSLAISEQKPLLFTRLTARQYDSLPVNLKLQLDYDPVSRTGYMLCPPESRTEKVAIVAAGTSDIPVAKEAARSMRFMGLNTREFFDIGVAGLWRMQERLGEINEADIVVAVAGMDAALVSVLGGLVRAPLIAVPTSVGYGACNNGQTALASCLSSCAPGVVVLNIDNGYGAACAAIRIANLVSRFG
ncbi:circadian phase modifier CpmA [Rhizobium leguminosarum bv. trifolii]|uniref:nickel pincer cofactor biosynthesis protein LarB n=1 Tax=Rhizobium leguminosarum TaxID=384 RepID=UPI000E2EC36C|nr:nickel pincer cofactor biosynthesis protein LarB [Rhizobium leguminosarum]RFB86087.1 circadian phase modifier CpmA [Rhizobium leguminosarum bv. trifolii]